MLVSKMLYKKSKKWCVKYILKSLWSSFIYICIMKTKKILFLKAQGLGDMIWGIPKLAELKSKWYEVYQTFYDMRHINKGLQKMSEKIRNEYKKRPMYSWRHFILEKFKKNWLIDDIIIIPYGFFALLVFLIKNFRKFDEVIIPVKTRPWVFLWKILGKKSHYIFEDTNDITKRRTISEWELWYKSQTLYDYSSLIQRETEKIDIPKDYIVIFPSIWERSPEMSEWKKVIHHIKEQKIDVVVLWWGREKRFIDELKQYDIYYNIIDLLDKTSFGQLIYILQHARVNISWNGGVMWLANLVNKKNINIHTVSAYLMEPPVNNIHSFNLRPYIYPECKPCEASISTVWRKDIPQCIFYKTAREWECRKAITAEKIITLLNKIL